MRQFVIAVSFLSLLGLVACGNPPPDKNVCNDYHVITYFNRDYDIPNQNLSWSSGPETKTVCIIKDTKIDAPTK